MTTFYIGAYLEMKSKRVTYTGYVNMCPNDCENASVGEYCCRCGTKKERTPFEKSVYPDGMTMRFIYQDWLDYVDILASKDRGTVLFCGKNGMGRWLELSTGWGHRPQLAELRPEDIHEQIDILKSACAPLIRNMQQSEYVISLSVKWGLVRAD